MIYIIICELSFNHVLKYFNLTLMEIMLRFRPHERLITAEARYQSAH